MTEACSICGGPIAQVALALSDRPDDGARICKRVVKCSDHEHITWQWTDRLADPIERDDSMTFVFAS